MSSAADMIDVVIDVSSIYRLQVRVHLRHCKWQTAALLVAIILFDCLDLT